MVMNMEYMQMVISRLLASLPLYCFPASRLLSATMQYLQLTIRVSCKEKWLHIPMKT